MNRRNELCYEIHRGIINSQIVIEFLDKYKFSDNLSKPTVVIIDQASIHTGNNLMKKLEEWESRNLKLFLVTY